MDKIIYSCLVITFVIKLSLATFCTIRNDDNCYYTVSCDEPGRINIVPYCSATDPFITLVLKESPVTTVTANYFITKFDPHVKILKAVDNKWDAVQDYAFSNFKNALYVDLSDNQIKTIGKAFVGLEHIDSLNLSRNHLEEIKTEVTMWSEKVNRLSLLDLSYNLLTFLTDDFFVSIYNLRFLYLQGNKLIILEDLFSANLQNLKYLNLCCSNYAMLNITWNNFNNLKDLDLSFNKLNTTDDLKIKSLESIILSHNNFENVMDINFEQFPHLQLLDLSYNRLKEIPRSVSPQNPDGTEPLIKIHLNNNNISYINETAFINFNYIDILNLSGNGIREIRNGTFRHVQMLKELDLSNCGLKLTNETFLGLDNTEVIEISRNNLTSLDPNIFKYCKEIQSIFASFNYIRSVDINMFQKLVPSLTRINVQGNPMDMMNRKDLTNMKAKSNGLLLQVAFNSIHLITEILCAVVLVILFLLLGAMIISMYVRVRQRFSNARL